VGIPTSLSRVNIRKLRVSKIDDLLNRVGRRC
jgi:hypothetical protein